MQKFMCYCTVLALFHFGFEGNFPVQVPGDGLGGAICRFFALRVLGDLYLEGHGEVVFGILRYISI